MSRHSTLIKWSQKFLRRVSNLYVQSLQETEVNWSIYDPWVADLLAGKKITIPRNTVGFQPTSLKVSVSREQRKIREAFRVSGLRYQYKRLKQEGDALNHYFELIEKEEVEFSIKL